MKAYILVEPLWQTSAVLQSSKQRGLFAGQSIPIKSQKMLQQRMTNNVDRNCECDQIGAKDNAVWFLSVLWTKMNYALNLWYHHAKGKGWLTNIPRTFAGLCHGCEIGAAL